jgi:hypothetical protein
MMGKKIVLADRYAASQKKKKKAERGQEIRNIKYSGRNGIHVSVIKAESHEAEDVKDYPIGK